MRSTSVSKQKTFWEDCFDYVKKPFRYLLSVCIQMARTRFGRRGVWLSKGNDWRSWKKKKPKKKSKHSSSYSSHPWMPYVSREDVNFISGLVHGGPYPYPYPYVEEEIILDDEIPHDELDDEVMFGNIRTDIVGVQYYRGSVNNAEMVCLEREPQNKYDRNAIRVLNLDRVQVGHLKREMAKPLAFILDNNLARIEGTVPFGADNMYKISVDLTLWGLPEQRQRASDVLRSHSVFMKSTPGTPTASNSSSLVGRMAPSMDYSHVITRREFLSPGDVKNELDKLFESLEEGDKTTMTEPAKAIKSPLYPHQKQALNWMVSRENGENMPPFWEKRTGGYFNSLTVSTSRNKPSSILGGILADDMGLGKTLEMISLILTNFVDKQPLAQPVPGRIRAAKQKLERPRRKSAAGCSSKAKEGYEEGYEESCPFERIRAIEKEIDSLEDEKENDPSGGECCSKTESNMKNQINLKKDSAMETKPASAMSTAGMSGVKKLKLRPLPGDEKSFVTNEEEIVELSSEEEEEEEDMDEDEANEDLDEDQNVMIQKVDKEFKPVVGVCEDTTRESARPRRSIKRPARYIYSDSDEENTAKDIIGSSKKQEPSEPVTEISAVASSACSVSGRGPSRGRGRGKGVVGSKGKGKAKAPSKAILKEIDSGCPQLPQLDLDELPDVTEVVDTQGRDGDYLPGDSDDSSDDDLPDIEIPFQCNEAGLSNCDLSTGRTKTDGARATLIVCPLSVLSNWLDQLEEHLHNNVHLEIYTYYGSSRTKNIDVLEQQDIVLTTYSTLSADAKTPQRPLQTVNWLRVVLDEGHVIRNPKAQQTKAVVGLKTERRWVLTGTPIQNSMKDLWSLINFLQISPLTDRYWWHRTIERPLGQGNTCAIKRVQHLMGNIALRRTKTSKINDKPLVELPERNVFIERIKLSEEERKVYTAMQNEGRLIISKYFQEGTLLHNYGQVLAILMRLRQMCCHPTLVARAAAAAKETQRFLEKMQMSAASVNDEARTKLVETLLMVLNSGSDEECSVCLDSLKAPVITPCAHVFCRPCIVAVINNEKPDAHCPLCRGDIIEEKLIEVPPESEEENIPVINIKDWQSSAKVDALMKALVKLREEDPTVKSLVVSQFTSFLTLIEVPLKANGFRFARLDGTMTVRKRTVAIQEFMELGPHTPTIFLLSLKAGGVGLNLTAASQVFLMDPAWNPASEDQCFDRCHRLGQKRDVMITKFLVEDSVEERMLQLQESKRQLMQGAFGKKPTAEQQRQSRIKDIKNLIDL